MNRGQTPADSFDVQHGQIRKADEPTRAVEHRRPVDPVGDSGQSVAATHADHGARSATYRCIDFRNATVVTSGKVTRAGEHGRVVADTVSLAEPSSSTEGKGPIEWTRRRDQSDEIARAEGRCEAHGRAAEPYRVARRGAKDYGS